MIRITDLTTDYATNPIGLHNAEPWLGWVVEADKRGESVSGWQILVASAAELLEGGWHDIGDSGQMPVHKGSMPPAHTPYGGDPLESRKRYHWKARVWDSQGRPGPWSDPAFWEMGLLHADDWSAQWIGDPEPGAPAPMLRRDFTIEKPVRRARAYVCGLGYAELRINGRRVGDAVLDPPYTQFNKSVAYVTHDITEMLQQGENAVAVTLGRGWFGLTTPNVWNSNDAVWHGEPRLLLQIEADHWDGTRTTIVSDGTWRAGHGPTRADSVQVGEDYDARLEIPGWDAPGFDDSTWPPARVLEPLEAELRAHAMPPIRVTSTRRPVSIATPRPGTHVFDMGENIAGWARIHVSGPAGQTVEMRYGEKLRPDDTVDNGNDIIHAEMQVDRYALKGDGRETWEPRFSYKGFQFVQVDGWPGEPELDDVQGREVRTDVAATGSFECSDELLNHIHRLARRSLLNNLHGIPTDTPKYEKNGWTGDAHLTAEAALANFDAHNLYAKWLDDMRDAQHESGLVPLIVPCPGWGMEDAPEWAAAYPIIAWTLFQHTGNRAALDRHYPTIRDYVDFLLSRRGEDGLSPSVLGDWLPPGYKERDPEGPQVSATGYLWHSLTLTSKMAERLGLEDDAQGYRRLASATRNALNDKCLDREHGVYHTDREVGYRQTPNVLALGMGFAPPDARARVLENLVADIEARDGHLNTGILGTKYLLPVLTQYGHVDLAYRIATQRTWPSWGHWIEQRATALWEAWDDDSRSRGHHMFGTIEDWFYQYLAGIRPAAPGYSRIAVKPYLPARLRHAQATLRTVRGTIFAGWEKAEDGGLTLEVEIPVASTALVHVPAASPDGVQENGRPVTGRSDVQFLHMDGDRAVCGVGSGVYRFTSSP